MGSFYRSKHELVLVFKVGTAKHTNNVELGRHGRNRTNVWDYAGANTFRQGRLDELAMHPTVKPVALIADAIKDASKRSETVLDPFCGSGSTIIAAEKTGRQRLWLGDRSKICRCRCASLAVVYGQIGGSGRNNGKLRGDRRATKQSSPRLRQRHGPNRRS